MSNKVRDRIYQVGDLTIQELIEYMLIQAFLDREEKIFKIDDVFVTGILAKEANVTHK